MKQGEPLIMGMANRGPIKLCLYKWEENSVGEVGGRVKCRQNKTGKTNLGTPRKWGRHVVNYKVGKDRATVGKGRGGKQQSRGKHEEEYGRKILPPLEGRKRIITSNDSEWWKGEQGRAKRKCKVSGRKSQ